MKKPLLLISLLGSIVIVLIVARVTMMNTISTTGLTLVTLQNQIDTLRKDNELLKQRYLSAAAYTTISEKAEKLGYAPEKSQIDLSAPLPLALR